MGEIVNNNIFIHIKKTATIKKTAQ